jgi:hypothetical protein
MASSLTRVVAGFDTPSVNLPNKGHSRMPTSAGTCPGSITLRLGSAQSFSEDSIVADSLRGADSDAPLSLLALPLAVESLALALTLTPAQAQPESQCRTSRPRASIEGHAMVGKK